MKIIKGVYQEIQQQLPNEPPEIGGVMGGINGVVSAYEIDKGQIQKGMCSYAPNVEHINFVIQNWLENGLDFYGIFHTHFFGVKSLSDGDVTYIKKIMLAMPDSISKLFFPIFVLPEREMIVYAIERKKEKISKVPLEIIND